MIAVSNTNSERTIRPPSKSPESRLNYSSDAWNSAAGHCTTETRPGPANTARHKIVSAACSPPSSSTNPAFPGFIWPADPLRSALPRGCRPASPQQLAATACLDGSSMSVRSWSFVGFAVKLNQKGDSDSLVSWYETIG